MTHSGDRLPTLAHQLLDAVPTGLWIDGKSHNALAGGTFTVNDPATEQPLVEVADARADDALAALDSAVSAADAWAATAPRQRSVVLDTAYRILVEREEQFAQLMTLELGRALPDSRAEAKYGTAFLQWFAEEAVRIGGRTTHSPTGTGSILVTREPVGPCLAITPWNFPLAMGTRKIGPALAAGNVMLVKPAHQTPLTMLALAAVFAEAGLPAGVLSVLPTTEPGAVASALVADNRLRKISFTGSTSVGRRLMAQSAERVQRASMELGGNAPFIVFDDADIDAAVDGAFAAKMRNGGQACTAANRILVQKTVADEFVEKLTARMGGVKLGPGYAAGTTLGPLVSAAQRQSVAAAVAEAISDGGRLVSGGHVTDGPGYFYPATVVDHVALDAAVAFKEIFGPVALISRFAEEAEAVDAANSTEYGLAAYFYSRDLDRCQRVAAALQSGMVGINRGVISDVAAPFGGIKESGIGREGGLEGIEEYLSTKYIALP